MLLLLQRVAITKVEGDAAGEVDGKVKWREVAGVRYGLLVGSTSYEETLCEYL